MSQRATSATRATKAVQPVQPVQPLQSVQALPPCDHVPIHADFNTSLYRFRAETTASLHSAQALRDILELVQDS